MPVLLQFDFPAEGPWENDMTEAFRDLANIPGFRWKIWTENESSGEQGGLYLFDDEKSARDYMTMHTERLEGFGVRVIRAEVFHVNEGLTEIDNGPIDIRQSGLSRSVARPVPWLTAMCSFDHQPLQAEA